MAKRLRFTIEGVAYHATLQENELAGMIAGMCPFTMDYTRSGENEYYAALPGKAVAKDCPSTTEGRRNGLYYFESWNALSLVFRDCNTAPYQIHHIGDFEENIVTVLEKLGRNVRILCEAECGLGKSIEDIKKLCIGAEVSEGGQFLGHEVEDSEQEISTWAKKALS